MKTLALVIVLLACLVSTAQAAPAKQSWQYKYKVWMPMKWQNLAHCEAGTRHPAEPDWQHNSGTYQGAMGFYYGTWDQYRYPGYPSEAYLATPWQQYKVALRVFAIHGYGAWGCFKYDWVRYS